MNRTIKLLMFSDIFVITGFGLMAPILAIFIKENLIGGTIFAAGLSSALYLIIKSMVQLPFSRYVDNHDDKVKWLILGTILISSVPFIYIFANHIYFIYFAQIIYGIGSGLAYPIWLGLWSTHLDKKHESFEWSLYSTFTGAGTALAAVVGAVIAQFMGFTFTFIFVGIMSFTGAMILIGLNNEQKKKLKPIPISHYHKRSKLSPKNSH